MKIVTLELANVKKVKALRLEPKSNGLTVIGGRNAQGKTSVLDAIAYAFGGEKFRPTNLKRDGAVGDTIIHIETDDGYIIERKGKNAALTITDPSGRRGGQAILDGMISKIAIDLPKFLNANDRDKADTLLRLIGVGDELARLEREEKSKYDTRTMVGREVDKKQKAAEDMLWHEDAPEKKVSVSELIAQQKEVLARNGLRAEHRRDFESLTAERNRLCSQMEDLKKRIDEVTRKLELANAAITNDGEDESTAELERQIADFEEINRKVEANAERTRRLAEAEALREQYNSLTAEIEGVRAARKALLDGAVLPYPGLSVENGVLTLDGKAWDCMSGSQQLIVGCSIAARLNPSARFVLLDKLEQLDMDTLACFGKWLEDNDLQCIATRVSTGGECSVVIEDGEAVLPDGTVAVPSKANSDNKLGDDW